MEFFTWEILATSAGALAMIVLLTEFTKDLGFIKKIPTQLWSFILALIVLYPAFAFTNQLTLSTAFLVPFNAIMLSLAANGGFDAVKRLIKKNEKQ